jgi:hypothetical protein
MTFNSTKYYSLILTRVIATILGSTMMPRPLLLLLASSAVFSSRATSATSPRRHLHKRNVEGHLNQDSHLRRLSSDDSDSNDNDDENNDDNNAFVRAENRVEQDFINMWSSSPSEWSSEYWDIFAVVLSLVIVGSLSACIACIAPWKATEELDDKNNVMEDKNNVMINETSEPGVRNDKEISSETASWTSPIRFPRESKEPSKELDANNVMSNATSEPGARDDKVTVHQDKVTVLDQQKVTVLDKPILLPALSTATYGTDYDSPGPLRSKNLPRKKRTLWSEVVSVWTEFFVDQGIFKGSSNEKQYDQPYRKYKERLPDGSFSEAPSRNTYQAPSPRKSKKKSVAYDTADASSPRDEDPPHKVRKYQGLIV